MKPRALTFLAAFLVLSACAGPQRCSTVPSLVDRVAVETSYRVVVSCSGEPAGYGSAVAVGPHTLLTARHVTEFAEGRCAFPSWLLVAADGSTMPAFAGPAPGDADVSTLIPFKTLTHYAIVSDRKVTMGEVLTMYTGHNIYSDALAQSFLLKRILAAGYWQDGGYLVLSGHIVPGNSGSGIFDCAGRLVGILSRGNANPSDENMGLAVPASAFP